MAWIVPVRAEGTFASLTATATFDGKQQFLMTALRPTRAAIPASSEMLLRGSPDGALFCPTLRNDARWVLLLGPEGEERWHLPDVVIRG